MNGSLTVWLILRLQDKQTFAASLPVFGGQRQHLCEVHLPAGRWMFTAAGGIFLAPMLPGARQALSCMTEHKRLTSERAVEVADRAHDEICVCSVCFSLL